MKGLPSMELTKPVLGITMGDAAGSGPEIVARTFAQPHAWQHTRPFVIGDTGVMAEAKSRPEPGTQ